MAAKDEGFSATENAIGSGNSVPDTAEETTFQPESKWTGADVKIRPGVAPIKTQ